MALAYPYTQRCQYRVLDQAGRPPTMFGSVLLRAPPQSLSARTSGTPAGGQGRNGPPGRRAHGTATAGRVLPPQSPKQTLYLYPAISRPGQNSGRFLCNASDGQATCAPSCQTQLQVRRGARFGRPRGPAAHVGHDHLWNTLQGRLLPARAGPLRIVHGPGRSRRNHPEFPLRSWQGAPWLAWPTPEGGTPPRPVAEGRTASSLAYYRDPPAACRAAAHVPGWPPAQQRAGLCPRRSKKRPRRGKRGGRDGAHASSANAGSEGI